MRTSGKIQKTLSLMAVCVCVLLTTITRAGAVSFKTGVYYYIATSLNYDYVVEVANGGRADGTRIQINKKSDSEAQVFELVAAGDGYYFIINKLTGKAVDVPYNSSASRTNLQLFQRNGTDAQKWQIYEAHKSKTDVSFKSKSGLFLDVSNGVVSNGNVIWGHSGNGTAAQAFRLIPYDNAGSRTVTLEFDDISSWMRQMEAAQFGAMFKGKQVDSPITPGVYNCNIISGIKVLENKTIKLDIPLDVNGKNHTSRTISFPSKVCFELHGHSGSGTTTLDFNHLYMTQKCSCGYANELRWQVPWADMDNYSTVQIGGSSINPVLK